MLMQNLIARAEQDLLHTYNRYPIVWEKGEGVHLYDLEGREYLDFVSGIGVFALGYGNTAYNDALKEQIDKLIHTSNYYYNAPAIAAAAKIKEASGMDRVFFTNSGAEAVEGALKAALKYAYLRDGSPDHEVIAMEHSFHGRTLGALSVTGNPHYREAFQDSRDVRVRFARMNDLESVYDVLSENTCAVIMETVQGEGGIYPATQEFLSGVKELCEKNNILLILDEIQCGMGRTGTMYAWQKYGIRPDIMTTAKALGCGVPVGAFLMTEEVAQHSLVAGDHGTTYGCNPLAGAAVSRVLDLFQEEDLLCHVQDVGAYLADRLDELVVKYDFVAERRGCGLLQGLECKGAVAPVIAKALEQGLLLINAGTQVIRFIPPLVITTQDVDAMLAILEPCLAQQTAERSE